MDLKNGPRVPVSLVEGDTVIIGTSKARIVRVTLRLSWFVTDWLGIQDLAKYTYLDKMSRESPAATSLTVLVSLASDRKSVV